MNKNHKMFKRKKNKNKENKRMQIEMELGGLAAYDKISYFPSFTILIKPKTLKSGSISSFCYINSGLIVL